MYNFIFTSAFFLQISALLFWLKNTHILPEFLLDTHHSVVHPRPG